MPLTQVFVSISDPRSVRHTRHDLAELLTVAVCAVLSGVDDFVDIELWAKAKIDWLRGFMKLEHGIPSHDTIGRVFGMIAPDEFESAFRRWVGMVVPALAGDTVVAIDGNAVVVVADTYWNARTALAALPTDWDVGKLGEVQPVEGAIIRLKEGLVPGDDIAALAGLSVLNQ